MTALEALAEIKGFARAGRYRFTTHALRRMDERGLTERVVVKALCYAHGCRAERDEKWLALGRDHDEDLLEIVVALEGEVIVITMY